MKLSLRSRSKRIIATLILVFVLILPIRNSVDTWRAYSYAKGPQPSGLIEASSTDSANPDYYFLIGYYLFQYSNETPENEALSFYKEALKLSPFNHNYWYFLADFYYTDGNKEKSTYALEMATDLSPGTVSLRWRAGMLSAMMGDSDLVINHLASVIKSDRNRHLKAFGLLWQSVGDRNRIYNVVSDNALRNYFYYLRNTDRSEYNPEVYNKLKSLELNSDLIAAQHSSDIIDRGDIQEARKVWAEHFGEWEGIWNGDFEDELQYLGFGWRLSNVDGVKTRKDYVSYSGDSSLMVSFEGDYNLNFQPVRQTIPVWDNSKYTLKYRIKTQDLISGTDITWQIRCVDNNDLDINSEPISGTSDWKEQSLSFDTPSGCKAIVLKLKRPRSFKLHKYVSGTLWIDEIELIKES